MVLNNICKNFGKIQIWRSRRYVLAFLVFMGYVGSYVMRVNFSIAIVAMNANKTIVSENGTETYVKEFDWDSILQGHLLSAFFYGYLVSMLLGGWLGSKFGGAKIYGLSVVGTAILTLFTPLIAKQSYYLLLVARAVTGIVEGVGFPCVYAIWANWAPTFERSRLVSSTISGAFAGTVLAMPLCAYLNQYLGWESVFYVPGALCIIWYLIWWKFVYETPEEDKYITKEELQYISESLGEQVSQKDIKHPWLKFLTSPAVWACMIAHFVENFGFFTMLTQLPKLMTEILHFDLRTAGILCGVPFLVMAIMIFFGGNLADYLIKNKVLKVVNVRRLLTCGAFLAQTVFLNLAIHLLSPTNTSVFITLAIGLGGFSWAGFGGNYLEIAPRHSSIIFGLGGTFAAIPGIVGPVAVGYIVQTPTKEEWQTVFYIITGIYFIGFISYGLMASGDVQPWAKESRKEENGNVSTNA